MRDKLLEFLCRVLKRKCSPCLRHPYDRWKTMEEVRNVLKSRNLHIEEEIGICYIPGYFFTYRLPRLAKKVIVSLVSIIEPICSRPLNKLGYLIAVSARKI